MYSVLIVATIRVRYHGASIMMNEYGVIDNNSAICGANVEVLQKSSQPIRLPYKGCREYQENSFFQPQYVKIHGIIAIYLNGYGFGQPKIDLRLDHYTVGEYDCGGVFILLRDGKPISRPLPEKKKHANNVAPIQK